MQQISNSRISHKFLPAFGFLLLACMTVDAEAACPPAAVAAERNALQRLLMARGVSQAERQFLLTGADKRIRELRHEGLNKRGAECGVAAVRAHVLRCVGDTLPSFPSSNQKTNASYWGKTNVSAREAAFIGVFHACRAGALEVFMKNDR
ncbi:hypothetical protein [Allomesorhizobium camelthorni]|uniref:Uncharacterized protein n=1 Tax=Allomesorhizobium camelthorni TaxID=475069 RepID=A0A6G4WE32_9HYPH|nr:hypothetical protein [Mesorhizobium camelthorni]NGO52869.1 hypothetical protein [Mesorhizobium camelthorni]